MKGFTRYYRDPEFRAAVDEEFRRATAATRVGYWITYAIHDASQPDTINGRPDGPIVYVGQTKNFGNRVRKRMSSAGCAVKKPNDRIDGLLYEIMARRCVPRWTVLEQVDTFIASLVSETNWAVKLRSERYPLVNQWTEHKRGARQVSRHDIDHKRLWPMTAADALGSRVDVVITELETSDEVFVDLATFPANIRLSKIKEHARLNGRRARLVVN